MYFMKLYFLKILKKLNLLLMFNFSLTIRFNNSKIKIPFINGSGLTNFVLKRDWLDSLIGKFVKDVNETFIDVGVNIGQTIIRVKTAYPVVNYLGFEPNSTCTSYVQQLIKSNHFANCVIQNCALSDKVQTLILEKTSADDSRASVIANLRPDYFEEKEFVLSLDYNSFYLDRKISLVKIDVEGGELEVLTGMKESLLKHNPIVVCEVLDSHNESVFEFTQNRATQLSDLLKSINYSIVQLETSRTLHKLVSSKKIDSIIIKQWTPRSYDFNDYLFYPVILEKEVFKKLSQIFNKDESE